MLRPMVPASLLSTLSFAMTLAAQGAIVDYSFEARDADQVVNWARGPQAAPPLGTVSWPADYLYTDGRFGSALAHSTYGGLSGKYVGTGWTGGHSGALTLAFFLRNGIANSTSEYSPVAGQPSWSLASGGSAGAGLQLTGWGGPALNGDFGVALCTMTGWNHFALVIDPTAGNATWYRNGVPANSTTITTGAAIGQQAPLYVGADYVNWCGSLYDIDEFRLLGRAATAAEIALWATRPLAATAAFGNIAINARLDAAGVPSLGNQGFALTINGVSQHAWVIAFGHSYSRLGALELPLDLAPFAPGQFLQVAPAFVAAGAIGTGGEERMPLPIPGEPSLRGAPLYAQVLTLSPEARLTAGNALGLRLGE